MYPASSDGEKEKKKTQKRKRDIMTYLAESVYLRAQSDAWPPVSGFGCPNKMIREQDDQTSFVFSSFSPQPGENKEHCLLGVMYRISKVPKALIEYSVHAI
jgi:hypothetical protein